MERRIKIVIVYRVLTSLYRLNASRSLTIKTNVTDLMFSIKKLRMCFNKSKASVLVVTDLMPYRKIIQNTCFKETKGTASVFCCCSSL